MSDRLFLNFSLFFYIAIKNNVNGRTNPNILSVLTNNDPDSYQNYGSCTSYFVNGQRKLPKNLCAPILSLTIDEITSLLKRLNIQNIPRSLNIFTGLLADDIIEIDDYIKNELLIFLTQDHDPVYCLAQIYKDALCDTHPLLILTSSLKKEIDVYMERYSDDDRFLLNSSKCSSSDALPVISFDFKKIFAVTAAAISCRINKFAQL